MAGTGDEPERSSLRNGDAFTFTLKKLPEKEYAESTSPGSQPGRLMRGLVSISASNRMNAHFEAFFVWLGRFVCQHPYPVILASIFLAGLGAAGLPLLHQENNAIKLWIPQESDFSVNYAWLWSTHPPDIREHSIILHGENILTPAAIQKMYKIYKQVYSIRTEVYNKTWENSCFRIPVVKLTDIKKFISKRRKRSPADADPFSMEGFDEDLSEAPDLSVNHYPNPYCGIVETLPTACFHETLLELWAHEGEFTERSEREIQNLSQEQILDKVNNWQYSELYLMERDFRPMLGGITYDASGKIIGARAAYMKWMGRMNATQALMEGGSDSAGTGEMVDRETEEFENALSRLLLEAAEIQPTDIRVEVHVANSFGQIASATIMGDVTNLILGFSIVFIYVNFMLGRFNLVEQRGFLSLMGLGSVGMAIAFAYGSCSVLGLAYGPLHNIIPFLLLGIGIDDMFVTTTCFNNLPQDPVQRKSLQERFGEMMRNAGCAITVTSVTDFIAFIIGGSTVLPALRSFCIFCAVGLLVVYIFQATWFIAWFSLDQRRVEAKKDGLIVCYTHENYTPNRMSQLSLLRIIFKKLAHVLMISPVKVAVILLTAGMLAVSAWGNVCLRQEFNPIWFLPPESYLARWHEHNANYFPSRGEEVTIFISDISLPGELRSLDQVHRDLAAQTDIVADIDSWYLVFNQYVTQNFLKDSGRDVFDLTESEFRQRLTQFLFSPKGSKYRFLFTFERELVCGQEAPGVQLSMVRIRHHLMDGPSQQIPAMNRVKAVIREANFSGRVFPMAKGYASWETDEVISMELYRNLLLAICCIFFTTWLLLFNLWACLQVLMCVVLTLANVGGFMHFWGLTIDTVSCTNLIISIGLCVDYSAHIAHAFLHAKGTRDAKVKTALTDIGPAVLNGGFSTFLAFVLLAGSRSHVFQSFFKIFFLVVVFGLYNGLVLLPVVLSLVGPREHGGSLPEEEAETYQQNEATEPLKPILKLGQAEIATPTALEA